MKILTIITFYLIVVSSSAQALDGKWMMTKEGDTYIIPENLILEINSDSLKYFSFDQFQSSIPIKIENNKLIVNQTQTDIVEFINEDRIKIKSQEKDKNSLNETEYVRLKKTKTTLSPEEIQNLSFKFNWNDEKFKVIFNKELGSPQVMRIMEKDELSKIRLEKIDSTYFISILQSGKRKTIFPIKEVSNDKMILYGMPRKPYEIVGKKIE
ncbi:hypothetical protein [Salegentibacter mishustinae]|uniref:DUF4412 domain-containing protein n=1 Tax=Salegentibacter mishustinae TaxID=270918 RepID=A0A0Q9ZBH4_9FLAO|nr:hypothetical protein [Salegentibacter mishustinae]KRG30283.1 hypothetical protein APR42_00025 [Salegentibacter mishustinae]PNW23178.1 hypothetical protein APB85_00020 [Salegentibacter mishustinae]PZX66236.1 hypothetical protein LY54_00627 [Salegentibacter mishustinae]GGW81246.1 hypothetical protein GCM10008086_06000 [Salegentibacter mishustinae]